jgi:NAD/NADP transhydrogenase alpha subunit
MVPRDASFTYGKNVQSLLQLLYDEKGVLNIDDEIMREAIVCHEGQWVNKALADSMAQESK